MNKQNILLSLGVFALIVMTFVLFSPAQIVEASVCPPGEYSVIGDKGSTCEEVTGNFEWAERYREFLLEIATTIALMVKSVALVSIMYSGIRYMRVTTDISQVNHLKTNIMNSFIAIFLAANSQLIISVIEGVIT